MTQGYGQMREVYPLAGDAFWYRLESRGDSFRFQIEGDGNQKEEANFSFSVETRSSGEGLCRTESGRILPFAWARVGSEIHLWLEGFLHVFAMEQSGQRGNAIIRDEPGDIYAPMPGRILAVLVNEGEWVERSQTVVVMESMKMELAITASQDGIVRRVAVETGQQVDRGMRLLELSAGTEAAEEQ